MSVSLICRHSIREITNPEAPISFQKSVCVREREVRYHIQHEDTLSFKKATENFKLLNKRGRRKGNGDNSN
uniref:Uncharacterized protein n=1 Tax=Octopus bimaculoides TaxID=37653 RepID=A0A0L8FLY6_OCTBM